MLLLKANVVPELNVNVILKQPEDYVDSKKYVSWERYFTDLLVDNTRNSPIWAYSKRKLLKMYLSSKVVNAVKKIMKLIEWDNS